MKNTDFLESVVTRPMVIVNTRTKTSQMHEEEEPLKSRLSNVMENSIVEEEEVVEEEED